MCTRHQRLTPVDEGGGSRWYRPARETPRRRQAADIRDRGAEPAEPAQPSGPPQLVLTAATGGSTVAAWDGSAGRWPIGFNNVATGGQRALGNGQVTCRSESHDSVPVNGPSDFVSFRDEAVSRSGMVPTAST